MADRLDVTFNGGTARSGELTWGQQHMWEAINTSGTAMNMCAVRPLSAGAGADEFIEELRYYLERFESMRTLLRFRPGGQLPRQVVIAAGVTGIAIIDVPDSSPGSVAASLAAEQETRHFDYEHELPIRMLLVRHDGAFTHLVTTLCHMAADGVGGFAMYMDYASGATGPVEMHPLDLAALQAMPEARRQSEASMRYWARHLRSVPLHRFVEQPRHEGPFFWEIRATSPRLALAVRGIARAARVDSGTVLMTLWAIAVTQLTGNNPAVIQILVSNRFRPGLATIASTIFQGGLVVIDLAGASFAEAVDRTRRAANNAGKHAYYDFGQWERMVADVAQERGGRVQVGCFFNNRPADGVPPERDITVADVAGADRATPTSVELPKFHEGLMLNATEHLDAYDLVVRTHTQFVSRAQATALVCAMEDLAAGALSDPSTPVRLPEAVSLP